MSARYFEYVGEYVGTRGDYGVGVRGGHNTDDAPDHISVFDPDFGDAVWIDLDTGIESGDWIEIAENEWKALT